MRNFRFPFSFSPVSLAAGLAGMLVVTYIALIAIVMSYAALTVEFSQEERSDEAAVALLESQYLDSVATLTSLDYASLGYAKPAAQVFVSAQPSTALR